MSGPAALQRLDIAIAEMEGVADQTIAEIARLRASNAELLAALKKVIAISDRKHDAWDAAHAAIAKATAP